MNKITKNSKKGKTLVSAQMQTFCSGPLPPPEAFEKYELILPGSADRILSMAEKQSEHRRELEKIVIRSEQGRASKGLWFGFLIGIISIIGGIVLIWFDKSVSGFIVILSTLVSLVALFVLGKKEKKDDLRKKEQDINQKEEQLKRKKNIIEGKTTKK